jgi:hypothetical protein
MGHRRFCAPQDRARQIVGPLGTSRASHAYARADDTADFPGTDEPCFAERSIGPGSQSTFWPVLEAPVAEARAWVGIGSGRTRWCCGWRLARLGVKAAGGR